MKEEQEAIIQKCVRNLNKSEGGEAVLCLCSGVERVRWVADDGEVCSETSGLSLTHMPPDSGQ